jgi:F1F0 ATPase subunit 2
MSEWLTLAPAMVMGLLLGAIFFGGLWWTVRKGVSSKHPALLFLGSLLLRSAIVVTGFYLVSDDQWQRLLATLLGFIIAGYSVTRFAGPPLEHYTPPSEETGHAP